MCTRKFVINRVDLGVRTTGYEVWNGKEMVGMTGKQLKDSIKAGEQVCGLKIAENGELVLDSEGFYTSNIMVKTGINTLKPIKEEESSLANIFYVVSSVKKLGMETVYEVVSSRFERTVFNEIKMKAMLELGVISGGVKLDGKELIVSSLLKDKVEEEKKQPVPEKTVVERPVISRPVVGSGDK